MLYHFFQENWYPLVGCPLSTLKHDTRGTVLCNSADMSAAAPA
jgi:hypothetical protein